MFVHLHVKSDYSLGYGTASIDELVERAAALGYRSLALTDLENLYGQVRFHDQCRLHGIHPITGIEFRPGFDGRRNPGTRAGRLVLLAIDEGGYRSLCRIVSRRRAGVKGEQGGPYGDPLPLAMQHAEGLFALSDDPLLIERLAAEGSFTPERLGLLLVRPAVTPVAGGTGRAGANCAEAALRLGVRLVADLDSVFLRRSDHPLHVLQLAISQGRLMEQTAGAADVESPERWLRPPADAAALFADLPEALSAAAEIADSCRFELGAGEETAHVFNPEAIGRDADELQRLCEKALARKRQAGRAAARDYRGRLDEELSVFKALGFSGFMLIVADILSHCRQLGIPVAVRGSAVSSLVLHLLGGSPVDPLAHGLLFERFLHAGKTAWPDVDIDLPWHRRDEVIQWVYQRFGEEKVAMVAAHHTFRYRSALREGLKAWGAPEALIERMSRALPAEDLAVEEVDFLGLASSLEVSDESGPAVQTSAEKYGKTPGLDRILPLIRRLVGRPRHIAVHPGGIVIDWRPLEDMLPLERAPKGVVITQYDLVTVAKLGLVKIDLLGNRCLSEIEEALALAGWKRPLVLESIPAEDPLTLDLIDRAQTLGCFQLESPAMRSLLVRLPIRRQSDLIAALALIRPGASAGEVKTAFVARARGEEPSKLAFPVLADRLSETYGLPIYEEDIMVLLARTGGVTLAQADELRRGIVKSGGDAVALSSLQAGFLRNAQSRYPGDNAALARARRAWVIAARFAAYSFNKAHAASYALLAYYSAYLKVHHPVEFGCALLNHHQGLYPLRIEEGELTRMGVKLLGPQVNASGYHSQCEGADGSTRLPHSLGSSLDEIPSGPAAVNLTINLACRVPPPLAGGGQGVGEGATSCYFGNFTHPPTPSRQGRGSQQRDVTSNKVERVRVGLDKVKGLSHRAASDLIAERASRGAFENLQELLERVRLRSHEVTALVLCGACDGLAPLDADSYPFVHEAAVERLRQKCDPAELDTLQPVRATVTTDTEKERVRLYQALVRVRNELAYLEMHLSAHPVGLLRTEAARYACLPIREAVGAPADSTVRLAAVIAAMRRVPTRQGPMQFITLEDETGLLEAAVLPAVYRQLADRVSTPGPFLVEGKLRIQQGAVHLEVTRLDPFHERDRAYGT